MCYEVLREAQVSHQTRYPIGMDETRYNAAVNHAQRIVEKSVAERVSATTTLDDVAEKPTKP